MALLGNRKREMCGEDSPCTGLNPVEQFPRPSTVTIEHPSNDAIGARQALMHFVVVEPALILQSLGFECSSPQTVQRVYSIYRVPGRQEIPDEGLYW